MATSWRGDSLPVWPLLGCPSHPEGGPRLFCSPPDPQCPQVQGRPSCDRWGNRGRDLSKITHLCLCQGACASFLISSLWIPPSALPPTARVSLPFPKHPPLSGSFHLCLSLGSWVLHSSCSVHVCVPLPPHQPSPTPPRPRGSPTLTCTQQPLCGCGLSVAALHITPHLSCPQPLCLSPSRRGFFSSCP